MNNDERKLRQQMEDYAEMARINRMTKRVFIGAGVLLVIALIVSGVW